MPTVQEKYKISPQTAIKIGGPVRYFVEINNPKELPQIFKKIKKSRLPFIIIGGLSNLLFSSRGFPGWVVKINIKDIRQKGNFFKVGAGTPLIDLIQATTLSGFYGPHKLIGIPGTVGGAVKGNAGANGTEISDFITSVKVFDTKKNKILRFSPKRCCFKYRSSIFSKNPDLVIIRADFQFKKKNYTKIKKEIKEIAKARKEKPYTRYPSAGSIFKNITLSEISDPAVAKKLLEAYKKDIQPSDSQPVVTIPAGYLIEKVGLKGTQINKAQISPQHANIIINLGGARSEDVLELIKLAKEKVKKEWGVELEEEIVTVQ